VFKHLHLVLIIWVLAISSVQAKSYIRDYTYRASDADSKITSRANALDQVKLILLQEIGTHIRQEINITKDGSGKSYASEDVEAITAGLTKVEIIEEKWNGVAYYLKAKIDANTESVLKALAEIKNEKSEEGLKQLEILKENQRKLHESRDEVAKLRKQLEQASSQEKEKIVIKYIKQIDQFTLSEIVNKGYRHEQNGEYDDAVYWYRKAAEQGYAIGQNNLGYMYSQGYGFQQNDKLAGVWFRKAAEQGLAKAQFNLGSMYRRGRGVQQSDKQALFWYRKAAEQGDVGGQIDLGRMYRRGRGVQQSDKQALFWYRKAAEQGDARAINSLSWNYASCVFICDGDKAVYWAKKLLSTSNVLKNAGQLDTVSAAYARANQFEKAISYQKKAIALLTKKNKIADYTSRLSLYKKGKPYTQKQKT